MNRRYLWALAIPAIALFGGCAAAGRPADDSAAPFNDSIREASLRADLFALAHDSTAGRLVGTPEIVKASDWIRARFEAAGLEPAGDGATFDQRYDLMWFSLGEGNSLTVE